MPGQFATIIYGYDGLIVNLNRIKFRFTNETFTNTIFFNPLCTAHQCSGDNSNPLH